MARIMKGDNEGTRKSGQYYEQVILASQNLGKYLSLCFHYSWRDVSVHELLHFILGMAPQTYSNTILLRHHSRLGHCRFLHNEPYFPKASELLA